MSTKTCKTCSEDKPVTDFSITDKARQYRYPHCKPCMAEKKRQERHAAPAAYNAYQRDYYQRTRETRLPQAREANLAAYHRLKAELLELLGGRCVSCGLTDHRVLQIDHILGGGGRGRLTLGHTKTWRNMRRELKAGVGQDKYQLLCGNCHILKTHDPAS